jgi:cell division protein FtsX
MTVAELREQAKKIPDVKGVSSMKKDELVELLVKAVPGEKTKPAKAEKPAKEKTKTKVGAPSDKSELKKRIRELKLEKREALSQHDREKARLCGQQIHLYKRRLRKMIREKTAYKKK